MPRWLFLLSVAAIALCLAGSALLIVRTLLPA